MTRENEKVKLFKLEMFDRLPLQNGAIKILVAASAADIANEILNSKLGPEVYRYNRIEEVFWYADNPPQKEPTAKAHLFNVQKLGDGACLNAGLPPRGGDDDDTIGRIVYEFGPEEYEGLKQKLTIACEALDWYKNADYTTYKGMQMHKQKTISAIYFDRGKTARQTLARIKEGE